MAASTDGFAEWLREAEHRVAGFRSRPRIEEVGHVERVGDGIAVVSGLPTAQLDEPLAFPGDLYGIARDLGRDTIGCVLLGASGHLVAGDVAHRTGGVVRVPAGEALLGRVVDPLGRPLDGGGAVIPERLATIDPPAPAIVDRAAVTEPLLTGITVVDAMFPIGRGQRELIIGDRASGKTTLAVDTIINQRTTDVVCIYAAIGQKSSAAQRVIADVRAFGAPARCLFVVADASDAPGLQWLAPSAAIAMAEHFMLRGRHALVVLDDLSKHAAVHRELALLLRQPPGREAYPADVFHLHARLLERGCKLSPARGGGSLTILPIAETQAGDLAAYIPTNLISITDGQLVVDARLFHEGHKPAVDVGRSVSRVGGKTQPPLLRRLAERMRLDYAQFLELEIFTRFSATVDAETGRRIARGRRIRALLAQPRSAPRRLGVEVALLLGLGEGLFDPVDLERLELLSRSFAADVEARAAALLSRVEERDELDEDGRRELLAAVAAVLRG
jgi:F-type H+/Na+-transporting ATPase subunit alpha